jgi:hypothetical protein
VEARATGPGFFYPAAAKLRRRFRLFDLLNIYLEG